MATETILRLIVILLALFGLCSFLAVILDTLYRKLEELDRERNDKKLKGGENDRI